MLPRMQRRSFLAITGASGAALAIPRGAGAVPGNLREVADAALSTARTLGATYADVRLVRVRHEHLSTRDDHVSSASAFDSFGAGVRVLIKGTWGFAASQDVTPAGARAAAHRASEIARANAKLQKTPVALAPATPARDTWQTPVAKDPFRVPLSRKLEILFDVNKAARAPGIPVVAVHGQIHSMSEEKLFFSSEGAEIDQTIVRVDPGYTVIVAENGDFEHRGFQAAPQAAGFEYVEEIQMAEAAPRVAREALEKMKADVVTPGEKDLVLLPTHLWLTIHESIGHSTELDRALGYEANFAGTSFATPDKTGQLVYGGENFTVYADKTTPGGLATCGYDDDGMKTQKWNLIERGVLVDWQTTREQAALIGAKEGHATAYAESWAAEPFQRMPNVSIKAGEKAASLDDLMKGVDDGLLLDGDSSYSIDQQRLNFQFSGDMAWTIKNGKKDKPVRHAAYQSTTTSFWKSLDQLGDASTWAMGGAMSDGKGEPMQSNPVSHGCPVSRFRKVRVLDARGQS